MTKINFSSILSKINTLSLQKSINITTSKPKSNPPISRTLTWNNPPIHFPENPLINNTHLGSCNRWCKKILNIVKAYIICESTSIFKTFKKIYNSLGLKILNKSNKSIKKLQNNNYSDLIAFRIKLLSGTLPTWENLHQLYPNQYPIQSVQDVNSALKTYITSSIASKLKNYHLK